MKNLGGHFAPKLGGHFELESGGHFKLELGGQYHWNFQANSKSFFVFANPKIKSYSSKSPFFVV
jgi:hypothetical protein